MINPRKGNYEIGETSKLQGLSDYNIWGIKMEAIYRKEQVWGIVENKTTPVAFHFTLNRALYANEDKLNKIKATVRSSMILSVSNKVIPLLAKKLDPAYSRNLLRLMFNASDQQQCLILTNKLFCISMKERSDVATYLNKASDLRDRLKSLRDDIPDKTLNNIVLNGLPRSYEMTIQGITYITNPSFEEVMGKILTKSHRLAAREHRIGSEEALYTQTTVQQGTFTPRPWKPNQFRGNQYHRRGRRGRAYSQGY
jgi:hypothetical protein